MKRDPVHRSLVAVDIEGYSRRQNLGHLNARHGLRQTLADAFDGAGVEIAPEEQQDQGDGFLTLVKPEVSKVVLIDGLVREIESALRRFNHFQNDEGRIRLRVALHSGEVHLDGPGFPGEATVTVMRLIDAEPVKKALSNTAKDIAVIVSDGLYKNIIAHGYGNIIPDEYFRVDVAVKEFTGPAWVRVPGVRAEEVARLLPPSDTPGPPRVLPQEATTSPTEQSAEHLFNNVHFGGPTSFGGYAAGRDITFNRADS